MLRRGKKLFSHIDCFKMVLMNAILQIRAHRCYVKSTNRNGFSKVNPSEIFPNGLVSVYNQLQLVNLCIDH